MTVLRFQGRAMLVADTRMEQILHLAKKAAHCEAPVLLGGESGTGKEMVARYIHEKSPRSQGPFVSVNCAAIPEGLLEAELFGYEKGAFTGALNRRIGKFELAHRGTLLLDEISEMPLVLQAKLLRVLQEGEVDRLGANQPTSVNTRIIATTNRDPLELVKAGGFREDLYYRLNVVRVECPPIRGRKEAITNLVNYMIAELTQMEGRACPTLSASAWQRLQDYAWPGNIRELQNVVHRALLQCEGNQIELSHLDMSTEERSVQAQPQSLSSVEKKHILEVLAQTEGNRTRAAQLLGISVRTLRNKLKQYRAH